MIECATVFSIVLNTIGKLAMKTKILKVLDNFYLFLTNNNFL